MDFEPVSMYELAWSLHRTFVPNAVTFGSALSACEKGQANGLRLECGSISKIF